MSKTAKAPFVQGIFRHCVAVVPNLFFLTDQFHVSISFAAQLSTKKSTDLTRVRSSEK